MFGGCCFGGETLFFKIEDGGRPAKDAPAGFVRTKQLCDYIVIIRGQAWFIDVKSFAKPPTRSVFFPKKGKPKTSTQRQAANFLTMYYAGYLKAGFMIIDNEGGLRPLLGMALFGVYQGRKAPIPRVKKVADIATMPPA